MEYQQERIRIDTARRTRDPVVAANAATNPNPEPMTPEEYRQARVWAFDNPHLSFYLRKALDHIDWVGRKK